MADPKFLFLFGLLNHSGEFNDVLSGAEHDRAVALCDGFGKMDIATLRELDLTWDWSHVRDSSDEALAGCHDVVKGLLSGKV